MQFDNVNVTAIDAIIEMLFGKPVVENIHRAYHIIDNAMMDAFVEGQQVGQADGFEEGQQTAHMNGFEHGYRAAEADYDVFNDREVDEDTVVEFSNRLGDEDFVAAPADEEDFWDRY